MGWRLFGIAGLFAVWVYVETFLDLVNGREVDEFIVGLVLVVIALEVFINAISMIFTGKNPYKNNQGEE